MKDYRNLLNIKSQKPAGKKNTLKVWMKWDSNDADYIEKTEEINPEILFGNKKLIYCLAYITLPYNFKGADWNDAAFCHHIPDNTDIKGLYDILADNGFMIYSDWGECHSYKGLKITYYNEEGKPFDVEFGDIYKRWAKMTYEEICKEINETKE